LLYESRARVAELCNLCWKDIREKTDGAALLTLFGKGSKTRKVTISPHFWQALKATKPSAAKGDAIQFSPAASIVLTLQCRYGGSSAPLGKELASMESARTGFGIAALRIS
jgi:integrase